MQICTQRMWRKPGSWRRASLKERTEQCRQKLKLPKLAVGTTHSNTFIPDEHRMEQQTWSSECNTGVITPPTSSLAPSFSVCPFWVLHLHPSWFLPSLPFFWYFPAHTLLPHHAASSDLQSFASNSHLTLPWALLTHAPSRNSSQRRLKPDFLFPTLKGALILISHFWGTQGMVI